NKAVIGQIWRIHIVHGITEFTKLGVSHKISPLIKFIHIWYKNKFFIISCLLWQVFLKVRLLNQEQTLCIKIIIRSV
ncbi:hypothetical protein DKM28_15740, partial [Methanosarcina mazei]